MVLHAQLIAALADIKAGRFQQALSALTILQDLRPQMPDVWRLSAMAARKTGAYAQAERWLVTAISLESDNPESWNALGLAQDDQGRSEDALVSFQQALDIRQDFTPAAINAGRVLLRLSRFDTALSVLEPFKQEKRARLIQAQAVHKRSGPRQALEIYNELLLGAPTDPQCLYGQSLCLTELGACEEALSGFMALSRGGFAPAHYALFTVLARLKRFDEAFQAIQLSLRANPADDKALHGGAQLLHMTGRGEQIRPFFETLIAVSGEAAAVYAVYVDVLVQMEAFDEARHVIARAIERFGDAVWLVNRRLAIEIEARESHAAHEVASALPAALHDAPELRGNLVRAYLMNGAFALTAPLIEAGVKANPEDRFWRALEAIQFRGVGDEARYGALLDLDAFTRTMQLEPPSRYADLGTFNAELASVLRGMHDFSAAPLDQSLRSGTQTPNDLRHSQTPVIQDFFAMAEVAFETYRQRLSPLEGHPLLGAIPDSFELVGAWSVRLGPGGRHVNHVHPEGWVSSVYYVDVPPQLTDSPDREGWLKFCEPPFPVPGQTPQKYVEPKAGELTLFPSYAWHGTVPIRSGERLTIAFDIAPKRG